jgi:hypothetical protein
MVANIELLVSRALTSGFRYSIWGLIVSQGNYSASHRTDLTILEPWMGLRKLPLYFT